jgi:hypothetical protein
MAEKKFRVQLDFEKADFDELNNMVDELDLSTRAELFRSGLRALRWITRHRKEGHLTVALADDRYIVPEFDFLEKIPAPPIPEETSALRRKK